MQNTQALPRQPFQKHKDVLFLLLFSLLCAFLFQLICSKSSPLYPTNDWMDVQCFATVGRSILDGKVLYRDIYEQKGPLIYFVHAAASLVSRDTMGGLFLFYVVFMGLHLFFTGMTLRLFGAKPAAYCSLTVLVAFFTHVMPSYAHGGSVEEMCLWLLSCTLLITLGTLKQQRYFSPGACLGIGAMAGVAILTKFTMAGFFLGLIVFVLIWYIREKQIKRLFQSALWFLLGICAVALPVVIYFMVHNAMGDFFTAYFYNNLFLYSTTEEAAGFASLRIQLILIGFGLVILGWKIFRPPVDQKMFFASLCALLVLCIGTYWGHVYLYYDLILFPFAVLLLLPLLRFIPSLPKALPPILLAACVAFSTFLSGNTYLMQQKREDLLAYRFAAHIRQAENPTLLNHGFLDSGFYRAADVAPTAKYFCTLNIPLPAMEAEHEKLISEGGVQFVITRNKTLTEPHYALIDSYTLTFENKTFTYFLYQLQQAP